MLKVQLCDANPDISPELRTVPILSCNSRRLGTSGA